MIQKTIFLNPPELLDENIKEKIVCIRSHRERIFKTSLEVIDNQKIFHNYGHGGAGWTFLFGSVHESIRQFEEYVSTEKIKSNKTLYVIGAGCYGLLTSILLARKGYLVKIIAKELSDIASYKAAGFFFPRPRKNPTLEERERFLSFGLDSYKTYQEIIAKRHPFLAAGAKLLPCYFSMDIDPGFQQYIDKKLMPEPENVIIDFQNGKRYEAKAYQTIFIDVLSLMHELERNRREQCIEIIKTELSSFSQIDGEYIFNCSGFGAKKLTGDRLLIPVQGHLVALKNQKNLSCLAYMINVKVVMIDSFGRTRDKLLYYAPKESGILGITFLRGEDSLTANEHEFCDLLKRSRNFFGRSEEKV